MAVTYSIHSGTPGEIPVEHTARSVDSYLDEQLNDIYGKAAVDFLGQWMDWEQCYNALKMDWGTVTIGEHDWWYRK